MENTVRPLRIALLGYGRMGQAVEKVAMERGHTVVCRIDAEADFTAQAEAWRTADLAIEFSIPSAAVAHIERCMAAGKPVVVGTTGWQADAARLRARCAEVGAAVVAAANFSVGVNIFLQLIRQAAGMLRHQPQYTGRIEETHHIHKLDAPSGTAVSMNEALAEGGLPAVPITSHRQGEVVGIHDLWFESEQDFIEIRHEAKSRAGFALGAVVAAEWLYGKSGWYGMADVLGFEKIG